MDIAKDKERANAFLKRLIIAQATMINCVVTCVVRINIYNDIDNVVELQEAIPPFCLGSTAVCRAGSPMGT